MKTAIIHYWILGMRGGEKVLEQLCLMFPDADIFTHVYSPDEISETIRSHSVQTTFIGKIPGARRHYKKFLSLMPRALESLDLSKYDLVISSESGPAKGVICRPDALHICYCHSPMRYIWDQQAQYFEQSGLVTRLGMRLLLPRSNRHSGFIFGLMCDSSGSRFVDLEPEDVEAETEAV